MTAVRYDTKSVELEDRVMQGIFCCYEELNWKSDWNMRWKGLGLWLCCCFCTLRNIYKDTSSFLDITARITCTLTCMLGCLFHMKSHPSNCRNAVMPHDSAAMVKGLSTWSSEYFWRVLTLRYLLGTKFGVELSSEASLVFVAKSE